MYARIFDRESERYYKSPVYGIFYRNDSVKRYIVLDPLTDRFSFADRHDLKIDDSENIIIITPDTEDFRIYEDLCLSRYKDIIPKDEYSRYFGIAELWGDENFINKLFSEGCVNAYEADFPRLALSDMDRWEYIETQEQADSLAELFSGFHDASLDKLTYECSYNLRRVTAVFEDSGHSFKAELCFEGVEDFHIYPPDHRCISQYWSGSLCVTDKYALWAEGSGRNPDNYDKEFDYILAMSLKWRRIGAEE